jgi:hypothetical protein
VGWWRWISPKVHISNRQHFEACVFSQIRDDLKSGDLCIEGSEKYADYRKQLISWVLNTFCEQAGLPTTAQAFKEQDMNSYKRPHLLFFRFFKSL